jgi:hypothetical protein
VKRKSIIGIALALALAAILVLVIRTEDAPPLSIAYEGISLADAGQLTFRVTKTSTNLVCFVVQEEQVTNDVWQAVDQSSRRSFNPPQPLGEWHDCPVPQTTNLWRLTVHYYQMPGETMVSRTKLKLMQLAGKAGLRRVARWFNPVELHRIHSPEMRGNKPVEKK